jgi:C4-dicarboxylate-specific signal transduction histidine kinase
MSVRANRSRFRLLVVIAAGFLVAAVLAISLTVWWLRSDEIDDASKNANNLATVLAEQTNRSVQSIEIVLNEIQERIVSLGATTPDNFRRLLQSEDTYNLLTERLSHLSHAKLIGLIDNKGRLVNTTTQWPLTPTDVSDRDYFQHLSNNNDKGIFISQPVADRIKGIQTVLFSKRINDANNEFIGVVVVGVRLSYFQHIYNSIASLPDQLFLLLRNDGTVITRYPDTRALSV